MALFLLVWHYPIMKAFFFIIATFFTFSLTARSSIESSGDILEWGLPATALGIALLKKDWQGTTQAAETFLATSATVVFLKKTVNSKRPNGHSGSFPSGHTAQSFAAAGFMQKRYGWKYGIPFLAAASYVGFTRLHARAHWVQDVLAGAAIGWLYSRIFVRPYCTKLRICAHVTADSTLICANYQF